MASEVKKGSSIQSEPIAYRVDILYISSKTDWNYSLLLLGKISSIEKGLSNEYQQSFFRFFQHVKRSARYTEPPFVFNTLD
jgi:hypothetical protein